MTQTLALLYDAYRELNAKWMFWIVLALSGIVVAAFSTVGLNARGLTILWWEWDMWFNTTLVSKSMFYHWLFATLGIRIWLTWIATILALVSTAGMMPDLITGGSIDLFVSKPIGRLRFFLTKYLAGLLFVALQVGVFSTASFFVIGVRGGSWDPRLFVAIPLAVLVFSYLFCVCVLLGLLTRSTVASLLLTILFWLLIYGLSATESMFLMSKTAAEWETRAYARQLKQYGEQLQRIEQRAPLDKGDLALLDSVKRQRDDLLARQAKSEPKRQASINSHRVFYAIRSFLPKTDEMTFVLQRSMGVDEDELFTKPEERNTGGGLFRAFSVADGTDVKWDSPEVHKAARREIRARTTWWVAGTSAVFEAAVLSIAAWIFCRRDF